MTKVLITGTTGMVGAQILKECINDHEIDKIICLVRKPLNTQHIKVEQVIIDDVNDIEPHKDYLGDIDIVFHCIGVYTGSVSKDQFKSITVDLPQYIAKIVNKYSPNHRFILFSAQGADITGKSKIPFAKYKGQGEKQVLDLLGDRFNAFRPSYIYPSAERNEPNLMYKAFKLAYPFIKLLGKNFSVTSNQLAKAMIYVGKNGGDNIIENYQIREIDSTII